MIIWTLDERISLLAERLIERRREMFTRQVPERDGAIENRHAAAGTVLTSNCFNEVKGAIRAAFKEFTGGTTSDLLGIVRSPDGTTELEAANWVRLKLRDEFDVTLRHVIASMRGGPRYRERIKADLTAQADALLAEAYRDLTIAVERATLQRHLGDVPAPTAIDLALIDALVSLKNRRAFDADLAQAFAVAREGQEPLALIRIDVDHFKRVNDEHGGHAVGDEALIAIARVLDVCVRGKGTTYRVGGDEFALVLPNHAVSEATAVGERVRREVNVHRDDVHSPSWR